MMRVLIAVTHLLGAGHLTRAAAIGRALARAGHRVTLVSGGRPVPLVRLEGLDYVQLPPVRAVAGSWRTLLDDAGAEVSLDHLERRRELLLAALARANPDVVVTELYPFGRRVLAAEFTALLEAVDAMRPRPLVACSLRDIVARPERADRIEVTHLTIARFYDLVLVHGDPSLVSLDESWPVDAALRARLAYTGYVDEGSGDTSGCDGEKGYVLVSGGSSAAALPLYRAAIAAGRRTAELPWRILVGPGVAASEFDALVRDAGPFTRVERARPDFRALLRRAAIFVGQAGYNTVMDLLDTGAPAILVPFEAAGETEQRLRADKMVALGRAVLLAERDLSGETLAFRVRNRAAASGSVPVDRDGADTTVRILATAWRARAEGRILGAGRAA
jgi:predicted glycosyltransferase